MDRRLRAMLDVVLVTGAAAVVLLAAGYWGLRIALPHVPVQTPRIEAAATRALGHRVTYAGSEARMAGFAPAIRLRAVVLTGGDGSQTRLESLELRIAPLRSLLARELRFAEVAARGLVLEARRDGAGQWWLGGIALREADRPGMLDWLLEWSRARLDGARVEVHDERSGRRVTVRASEVLMRRGSAGRRLHGRFVLTGDARGTVGVTARVQGLRAGMRSARWELSAVLDGVWLSAPPAPAAPVLDARYGGALYARGQGARIERASGEVEARGRLDGDPADGVRRAQLAGVWQRRTDGWVVGLDRLMLGDAGAAARDVLIERAGPRVRVRAAHAALADDPVLWAALRRLPWVRTLPGELVPALRVRDLAAVVEGDQRAASGRVEMLGWGPRGSLPGAQGIAGAVRARGEHATLVLDSAALEVALPRLYAQPVRLDAPQATAVLHREGGVWALTVPELRAHVREIPAVAALQWRMAPARTFGLVLALDDLPAPRVAALLPDRALHPHVLDWYRKAVQGGTVHAPRLLLYGPPGRFLEPGAPARFLVQAGFEAVGLDYLPDASWPALRGLAGTLGVDGRTLTVEGGGGTEWDTAVARMRATIADMRAPQKTLAVEAELRGEAADLVRLGRETPLRTRVGGGLDALALTGRADTALELEVALTGPKQVRARARATLAGARLKAAGAEVESLAGTLVLDDEALRGEGLSGRFLGGDAEFSLAARPGGGLRVDGRGSTQAGTLAGRAGLAAYATGPAAWSATLERDAGTTTVDAVLDLTAAALELPAPLGKAAGTAGDLRLRARCCAAPDTWRVDADLPGPGAARLELGAAEGGRVVLRRGELALGLAPELPQDGLRVRANIPHLDADPWLAWLARAGVPTGLGAPLAGLELRAGALVLAGRTFAEQRLAVTPSAPWRFDFDGPQLAGTATFDPAAGGQLDLGLTRLHWPDAPQGSAPAATGPGRALDPARFPVVNARIAELRLGGRALGRLELDAERVPDGLRARRILLTAPFATAKGEGEWTGAGAAAQTRFAGAIEASDLGQMLRAAGFGNGVERGQGELRAQLQWPGAPTAFVPARAGGEVQVRLADATLPDVEPGLGRLFGVLSLETLQRRLLLDFRDVFGRGFVVDDLRGRLTLEPGAVRTDELRVRGPAAHLTLRGALYLPDRVLDLDVNVVPQLTSSLPAAVAIGSLGVGAAVLIGQRLFGDAINEITAQDYRVTGTLEAPQVTRVPAP